MADEANDLIRDDIEVDIQGYDLDGSVIKVARRNAREAGVDHLIHFQERNVKELSHPKKYGFIITNPPYGERLEDKKDLPELYHAFGRSFAVVSYTHLDVYKRQVSVLALSDLGGKNVGRGVCVSCIPARARLLACGKCRDAGASADGGAALVRKGGRDWCTQ